MQVRFCVSSPPQATDSQIIGDLYCGLLRSVSTLTTRQHCFSQLISASNEPYRDTLGCCEVLKKSLHCKVIKPSPLRHSVLMYGSQGRIPLLAELDAILICQISPGLWSNIQKPLKTTAIEANINANSTENDQTQQNLAFTSSDFQTMAEATKSPNTSSKDRSTSEILLCTLSS